MAAAALSVGRWTAAGQQLQEAEPVPDPEPVLRLRRWLEEQDTREVTEPVVFPDVTCGLVRVRIWRRLARGVAVYPVPVPCP